MKVTVDNSLIEAAQQLAPVIREHNEEAERERRLSKPVLHALTEAGLLRMATPRSLGGLEVDPITYARVIEEVTGYDSAAGWTLANPSFWAWFAARLPDEGVEEIYKSGPNALIAGPFHPPMQATPVQGGYRVTGRAPLASNCHDADWMGAVALVMDGDQPRVGESGLPDVVVALFPAADCEILDTWHVMGMRGTGSDDIAVSDVFVPKARTTPLVLEFERGSYYQGPLYRLPFMIYVAGTAGPIVLAIARNAIDEVSRLAREKTPLGSAVVLRERASVQAKVAQAEAALRSARLLVYDTIGEVWERTLAGEEATLEQKADLLLAAANASSSAAKAVELMYSVAGSSGFYTRNPIERHFRDMEVLKQHGFYSESRYETVGQVYLGLPPDFFPVAL